MRFSIIIPIYNVEKYITECIHSVIKQNFRDYEIILINDGSPDNCPKICDDYAEKYQQINVVHQKNMGLSGARNTGIKIAKGEYITFLDSDDYFCDKNILSKVNNEINKQNVDLIVCDFVDERNRKTNNYSNDITSQSDAIKAFTAMINKNKFLENACSKFFKRELIINNNLYFVEKIYHEDTEWIYRLCLCVKTIKVINERCYYYRDNPNSIMNNIEKKHAQDVFYSAQMHSKIIKEIDIDSKFKQALLSYLALHFYNFLSMIELLPQSEQEFFIEKAKELQWITKYTCNRQGKIHKLLYKLFGIKKYIKLRRVIRRIREKDFKKEGYIR